MKRSWFFLGLLVWASSLHAQEVITLAQAVDRALSAGDTIAQIQSTLQAAKAANDKTAAQNGFTVGVTLAGTTSETFNTLGASSAYQTATTPYSSTTVDPTGVVIPTTTAGSLSANKMLLISPSATLTAGTPALGLTVTGTPGIQTYPDGSYRNVDIGSAKLNLNLWNGYLGGPTQAAADLAGFTYQIAQLNAASSRNAAVLAVKQAYFTMLIDQENLNLLQATLDSWKQTLQITQFKFDQKTETAVDVLTAQVNVRTSELNLTAGQQALVTARQRLANLMGMSPATMFQIQSEPDPTSPAQSLGEAVSIGLKTRPEVQIADLNAKSALVNLNLAYGDQIPFVTLTGGVTDYYDLNYSQNSLVGQVGVTVQGALLDAGYGSAAVSNAAKTQQAALAQIHQLTQSIPVDIQEGWNNWQIGLQKMAVAVDNKKAYDEQLEITRTQFQTGSKALTDLLTAQTNATNADVGLLQAKINAQLAALQLQYLLGM